MKNEWLTEEKDLKEADEIIKDFLQYQDKVSLEFIEKTEGQKTRILVKKNLWIEILMEHFQEEYGKDTGTLVANKVLSRFMTQNHTIH